MLRAKGYVVNDNEYIVINSDECLLNGEEIFLLANRMYGVGADFVIFASGEDFSIYNSFGEYESLPSAEARQVFARFLTGATELEIHITDAFLRRIKTGGATSVAA